MLPYSDKDIKQTLLAFCNAICPLTPEAGNEFAAAFHLMEAGRKEVLTFAGEREKYLYFVLQGVQRVYYFDDENREATLVFTYAPSFGGVLDAMLLQTPSAYFYETLTPSLLLRLPVEQLFELMDKHHCLEIMVRKGLSAATSGVLARLAELQCYSAEDRYRNLLRRSPHILQLVPHKYLANYLGMDPTNFSKFMNRIKI